MTGFEIKSLSFDEISIEAVRGRDRRYTNWPVVYTINNDHDVYVGQTTNSLARMAAHLKSEKKTLALRTIRLILDDTFNVSVALDLESHLIRWFFADKTLEPINANAGVVDRDYYGRGTYRQTFAEIFERLRGDGLFAQTREAIENNELFKFSPFKSLNEDQAAVVEDLLERILDNVERRAEETIVVQGDPGTGKTIVAVTLMKILADIKAGVVPNEDDPNAPFGEFYLPDVTQLLRDRDFTIGLVAPQPGLRESLGSVFRQTPNLSRRMALSAAQVGRSNATFGCLLVDETHRLAQPGSQGSGFANKAFSDIHTELFGSLGADKSQLDWIIQKSHQQVLFVDADQSVRPRDLAHGQLREAIAAAQHEDRHYSLISQMRVKGGSDYVNYVKDLLRGTASEPKSFGGYEFVLFTNAADMQRAITQKNDECELARMLAGFAWPWTSKDTADGTDFELDGHTFRWNGAEASQQGWATSANAINEVGSIHTIQGFDLTYAGVIIGPDLRYDPSTGRTVFHPESYADSAGNERNRDGGRMAFSDDDIRQFVLNIYAVLMTRGIYGTYVYACDANLHDYLAQLMPTFGEVG